MEVQAQIKGNESGEVDVADVSMHMNRSLSKKWWKGDTCVGRR
jgi:hypothetical protein